MNPPIRLFVLSGLLAHCFGASITPYNAAFIEYCVGAFAVGQCTVTANSSGAPITASGTATTSGESINYTASSISVPGTLGGSASLTSNTFNSSGPGIMVDAVEQLVDSVTIGSPSFTGSIGYVELLYNLDGTLSATGVDAGAAFGPHSVPYACVKIGINNPIFPFGCTAYARPASFISNMSVDGTFGGVFFPFVYGQAFPLWFQLESIAGTGFGAGRATGLGSSAADFYNTASIAGMIIDDANMDPLNGTATITSALGISYRDLDKTPEPETYVLVGVGILWLAATRRCKSSPANNGLG